MNKTPTRSILLPLPIELPDELLEESDCLKNETQFAAFHYDPRSNRLLRENGISIKPCPNEWILAALYCHAGLAKWCDENKVQLTTGIHWLIYDYWNWTAYIADRRTALKCIEQQALPITDVPSLVIAVTSQVPSPKE